MNFDFEISELTELSVISAGHCRHDRKRTEDPFTYIITVELQWLKQAWDYENRFQSKVVPASQGKFLYLQTEL